MYINEENKNTNKSQLKLPFKDSKNIVIPLENDSFIVSYIEEKKDTKSRLIQGISDNKVYAIDCNSKVYLELILSICKANTEFKGKQLVASKKISSLHSEQNLPTVTFYSSFYNHIEDFKDSLLLTKKFKVTLATIYDEIEYCLNESNNDYIALKKELALASYKYKMKFQSK